MEILREPAGGDAQGSAQVLPRAQATRWVLWMLLAGTVLDYGGGLYLKPAAFALALLYLLNHEESLAIWARCLPDLLVVLAVPAVFIVVHAATTRGVTLQDVAANLWRCLGSPAYFLFVPLFYLEGARSSSRVLVIALTAMAGATILLVAAHAAGLLDLFALSETLETYRLAQFGSDARAIGLDTEGLSVPAFSAVQAFPLAFTLALGIHPLPAVVLAVATVLSTQRAQVLGLVIGAAIVLATRPRAAVGPRSSTQWDWRRLRTVISLALVAAVAIAAGAVLFDRALELLAAKAGLWGDQDVSLQVRIGHLAAYWGLVDADLLGLAWGYGPFAPLVNTFTGDEIYMTEMPFLIYLVWYGWPYTLAFYGGIVARLRALFRSSSLLVDRTMVAAAVVLVAAGNVNPVMHMPVAFLLLGLVRARLLELEDATTEAAGVSAE